MLTPVNCIALNTIKYNDKHSILRAYSMEMGQISFLIPAGSGREAIRRRALLMPLCPFQCIADIKPGRDINLMKDLSTDLVLSSVHSHPVKSCIALFVSEVLSVILREEQGDNTLFHFLRNSLMHLNNSTKGIANFHICFLMRLIHFLGLEPDYNSYQSGYVFDYADGVFRATPPLHTHFLSPEESAVVKSLSRMTFDNMQCFKFSRIERRQILDTLLQYYTLHYTALSYLNSLDVLKDFFD